MKDETKITALKKEPSNSTSTKVKGGLRWVGAARTVSQVFSWCVTLFVIRLLEPEDYGLKELATLLFPIWAILSTLGLEEAIVGTETPDEDDLRKVFGVLIVVNFLLFVAQITLAPVLAIFFDAPRIFEIAIVASVMFFFTPFKVVAYGLLAKDMDFKSIGIVETFSIVVATSTMLGLAIGGFGVWALVWGQILDSMFRAIGYNLARRWLNWPKFDFRNIRNKLKYGGLMASSDLMEAIRWRLETSIIGKILGIEELGLWTIAKEIGMLPGSKLMPIINSIAFPAFRMAQSREEDTAFYLSASLLVLSTFMLPLYFGIAVSAHLFVPLLLGDTWDGVIIPLVFVSFGGAWLGWSGMFRRILSALGKPNLGFGIAIAELGVFTLFISLAVQYGINALALSWTLAAILIFSLSSWLISREREMAIGDLVDAVRPGLVMSVIMVLAFIACDYFIVVKGWSGLLVKIALAGLVYASGLYVFYRKTWDTCRRMLI